MFNKESLIDTSHYPIHLGSSAFSFLKEHILENSYSNIFILLDDNTEKYCLPYFLEKLDTNLPFKTIVVKNGEVNKNLDSLSQILRKLSFEGGDRKSLMINLGGGVVTDIGGFAASIFKRGIDFVNIPTTLLSMVDASVGGKTGIDLDDLKNQVGTFSFPKMIIVDFNYLQTLPPRELKSGFAEMLKHGLIANQSHWEKLKKSSIDIETLSSFIADSIEVKKQVVESDPFEKGLRKILNFGHTIGHAIESHFLKTESPYLHGEAIAIGMISEAFLSFKEMILSQEDLLEISSKILSTYSLKPVKRKDYPPILDWMKHDKKNELGKLKFSLINGIGDCKYDLDINSSQIEEALDFYNDQLNAN